MRQHDIIPFEARLPNQVEGPTDFCDHTGAQALAPLSRFGLPHSGGHRCMLCTRSMPWVWQPCATTALVRCGFGCHTPSTNEFCCNTFRCNPRRLHNLQPSDIRTAVAHAEADTKTRAPRRHDEWTLVQPRKPTSCRWMHTEAGGRWPRPETDRGLGCYVCRPIRSREPIPRRAGQKRSWLQRRLPRERKGMMFASQGGKLRTCFTIDGSNSKQPGCIMRRSCMYMALAS